MINNARTVPDVRLLVSIKRLLLIDSVGKVNGQLNSQPATRLFKCRVQAASETCQWVRQ
jgi:hypothetical protein